MTTYTQSSSLIKDQPWFRNFGVPILMSLLLSGTSWIAMSITSISPVPICIEGQLIFFTTILLGKRRAALAIAGFLLQAAMGLPVLAGCSGGLHKFVGPTAGYLFFFLISPYVVGPIYERLKVSSNRLRAFFAMSVATVLCWICGAAWLAVLVGVKKAILMGILPFILGDVIKVMLFSRFVKPSN